MDDEKIAGIRINHLCEKCFHKNVCKFKDNHSNIHKKLNDMLNDLNKDTNNEYIIIAFKCNWYINEDAVKLVY